MAERKVEPVEDTVEDAPAPSQTNNDQPSPSSMPEAQQSSPASAPETSPNTSFVRNSVLDEVVAHHEQRIAELERRVEKRKETYRRLSSPSSFIPPPGLGVVTPHAPPPAVPPGSAAPPSPAAQPPPNQPNPLAPAGNAVNATQQQQHQSQPLAHNPAMAATMAAITAVSTPAVSAALHPQYPFFPYPHPDNPVMASPFMGVVSTVPPHPAHPPVQPPAQSQPSQPNPSSEDGGNRQSRYWTPDEHQRFLAAVNTYGSKNYQQIAEVVGTRNARQVRTHSQKYQKKLEREEARRRGDGRAPSDVQSPALAAAPAGISDGTPGAAQNQLRQNGIHRGSPATASSIQRNLNRSEAPQSGKSAEGSSSTNNASSERNAETSSDPVHANAEAAAAAVLAEAVALGRGRLPPGALTMMNNTHAANSTTSALQTHAIRPREAKAVKPNGSHAPPTPSGAALTNPGKTTETQNKATSPAVIRPSARTTVSASRLDAKASTTIPAGRGAESHQVTERVFDQKMHASADAITPSRRPSHSSVNGAVICSRLNPDKQLVPKLVQSAVKIEPRIVASKQNGGPIPGTRPPLATAAHSRLTVLPSSTHPKPVVQIVTTRSSTSTVEPVIQKPAAEVKNARAETDVGSNGPVTSNTEAPVLAHGKGPVPNGKHVAPTLSQRAPQVKSGVTGKLDAPTSRLPAAPTPVAQSSSAPSTNLDAAGEACDPCRTSGNGEVQGKSKPICPPKMKTADQASQQTHVEKRGKTSSDPRAPRSSGNTRETVAKDAPEVRKEKDSRVQSSVSKSAAADGVAQEQKLGCVHKDDMDTSEGNSKDGTSPNEPAGRAISAKVPGSRNSNKPESENPAAGKPSQEASCNRDAAPNGEKVVSSKGNQAEEAVGDDGQTVAGDQKTVGTDTEVTQQCSNPVPVAGATPNGQNVIKASLSADGDTPKEAEGPSSDETGNGHMDYTNEERGSAHDGGAGGGREEEEVVEQQTKEGDNKRPLEKATESVAKRQKGSDEVSEVDREECASGMAVDKVKQA